VPGQRPRNSCHITQVTRLVSKQAFAGMNGPIDLQQGEMEPDFTCTSNMYFCDSSKEILMCSAHSDARQSPKQISETGEMPRDKYHAFADEFGRYQAQTPGL